MTIAATTEPARLSNGSGQAVSQRSSTPGRDRTVVLERLRRMLGSLLDVSPERLDNHTPFLEMGADSIILLNALQALQQEFGVRLSMRQFFEEYSTLDALAELDERQSRIVELRFFAGLSIEETAEVMHLSPASIKREWQTARAWLFREMTRTPSYDA